MTKAHPKQSAVLPLGIKNRYRTELPALVALNAIGEPWFADGHLSDLLAVGLVVAEMAPPESDEGHAALVLVRRCQEGLTGAHKTEVAELLADCLPWLQAQPNARVQRALEAVMARHCPQAA